MLTFNATLPLGTNATGLLKAYSGAGGAQGLLMRVSQAPCKASGPGSASLEGPCCSRGFCGNWAGAALRSRGATPYPLPAGAGPTASSLQSAPRQGPKQTHEPPVSTPLSAQEGAVSARAAVARTSPTLQMRASISG